jgi:tetratricopeptide (TPR) repeat protein
MRTRLLSLLIFTTALIMAVAFRFIGNGNILKVTFKKSNAFSQRKLAVRCGVLVNDPGLLNIPALPGWGNYKWKITSSSDSVQFYFNQGINMYYAFHTLESQASFDRALQFDSTCAMAWYGKALALGPTINYGNGYRAPGNAWEAAMRSKQYEVNCTGPEKGLIEAISLRYSSDSNADLKTLQLKYAESMRQLALTYPQDADVVTLYADALMLEHPWDLYNSDLQPKPWTPQIRAVLVQALAIAPLHPGANHFMIHTLEGSRHPEEALKNAETLAGLMPDVAHVVHMPSHIYIRTGNYTKGILVNDQAVKGYYEYLNLYQPVINNALLYQIHAEHLKFNCALDAGSYSMAIQTSDTLRHQISPEYLATTGPLGSFLQYAYLSGLFAEIRFGKWENMLKEPLMDSLPYAVVLLHFGRGMAFAHLNRIPEAEKELTQVKETMQVKTLKEPADPFSSAYDACRIAEHILQGVVAEKQSQYAAAIDFFRKAISAEDHLVYNEPRDWLLPARQYLGNLLLKTGDYRQAIKVFKKDLVVNPLNGWSLTGLQIAYTALHDTASVKHLDKELERAWQIKDVAVNKPVF